MKPGGGSHIALFSHRSLKGSVSPWRSPCHEGTLQSDNRQPHKHGIQVADFGPFLARSKSRVDLTCFIRADADRVSSGTSNRSYHEAGFPEYLTFAKKGRKLESEFGEMCSVYRRQTRSLATNDAEVSGFAYRRWGSARKVGIAATRCKRKRTN